ncbi:MAG: hypothetical protein ACPGUX_00840 [Halocynthiibacter sp.]
MKSSARSADQDSVSLFFILDGQKYQAQAIMLAASLRYFNADRYKIFAYVPETARDDMERITLRIMRACNVEIRILKIPEINGRTPFNGHYPHGNKILAAAETRPTDISVFLDSDMVCCAPLDFENLVAPGEMRAVVSDYATGWYNMKRWRKAYHHFGLEVPEQRVKFYRGRQLTSPPYFNAGMVGFRENTGSDEQHLGKVWLDIAHQFDWDLDLKYERNAVDQLTLPIVATRLGLGMPLTSTDYNYNIMRRPFDPELRPKILHYHRFVDLWAWPFGKEMPRILTEVVGKHLAMRAMRVFRQHYRMPSHFDRSFS